MNALSRYQPVLLAVLRITTAYMFILHGTAKLFALPHVEMFDNMQIMSIYGLAGIFEVVGGILLLLGLFTRPVAFILAGQMAVAYFMAHSAPSVFLPLLNGGEPAALFCFIFLYIASAGAGVWALDNRLQKA
ncbi:MULTISPECIES: DoxX family protein [Neisseria]|uniref:LuxR family transcriptional regulator n=1 Tax=Neisseria dumasiana TaxID=1931275 RepID=A0A1X3DHS1_9NEIS|nr:MULTISPECIES: DoxX family protein [Neisseria]KPN74540.1 LuxR family transcriptional regulator [Neisseria sp. 74A18]OSI15262.1 LuxR family transcriptional regulator [Neisseria dumasiana]OSI20346.1 LuxR family transcriptional regulator [Neisseria dumasiana]OSI35362.1 LuxR family transcriptional regulator [Neisseria dumasiana]UOO85038.1 DoxX family protein [Neisseria dumasiana]